MSAVPAFPRSAFAETVIRRDEVPILVAGSTSSGKSLAIGGVLLGGRRWLRSGIGCVTARFVRIVYAEAAAASLVLVDFDSFVEVPGSRVSLAATFEGPAINDAQIAVEVRRLTEVSEDQRHDLDFMRGFVQHMVELRVPHPLLQAGVVIYDSPGTAFSDPAFPVLEPLLKRFFLERKPHTLFAYKNPELGDGDIGFLRLLSEWHRGKDFSPRLFFMSTHFDIGDLEEEDSACPGTWNGEPGDALMTVARARAQHRLSILQDVIRRATELGFGSLAASAASGAAAAADAVLASQFRVGELLSLDARYESIANFGCVSGSDATAQRRSARDPATQEGIQMLLAEFAERFWRFAFRAEEWSVLFAVTLVRAEVQSFYNNLHTVRADSVADVTTATARHLQWVERIEGELRTDMEATIRIQQLQLCNRLGSEVTKRALTAFVRAGMPWPYDDVMQSTVEDVAKSAILKDRVLEWVNVTIIVPWTGDLRAQMETTTNTVLQRAVLQLSRDAAARPLDVDLAQLSSALRVALGAHALVAESPFALPYLLFPLSALGSAVMLFAGANPIGFVLTMIGSLLWGALDPSLRYNADWRIPRALKLLQCTHEKAADDGTKRALAADHAANVLAGLRAHLERVRDDSLARVQQRARLLPIMERALTSMAALDLHAAAFLFSHAFEVVEGAGGEDRGPTAAAVRTAAIRRRNGGQVIECVAKTVHLGSVSGGLAGLVREPYHWQSAHNLCPENVVELLGVEVAPRITAAAAAAASIQSVRLFMPDFGPDASLADHIRLGSIRPQTTADVARLMLPLARCLVRLHAAGLIHRDLKPHNILVRRAPAGLPQLFLADFGITRQTATTSVVGTPGWLAPEQAQPGRTQTCSADVFSFACVLYALCPGSADPMCVFYPGGVSYNPELREAVQSIGAADLSDPMQILLLRCWTDEVLLVGPPAADADVARVMAGDGGRRPTMEEVVEALERMC